MVSQSSSDLRSVDRELLAALRAGKCMGVGGLTEELGVTATAVRQRIDRLMDKGLVEREKLVSGRGRPTFCYKLTVAGHQKAGADPTDLAEALWREVISIADESVRDQILSGVAKRLGRKFAEQAEICGLDQSGQETDSPSTSQELKQRLHQLTQSMSDRKIPMVVSDKGEMPVLDVNACPFPTLTDHSNDRTMCRLEEQMISEALGQPMKLSSCRLDGDDCCQFSVIAITGPKTNREIHNSAATASGG